MRMTSMKAAIQEISAIFAPLVVVNHGGTVLVKEPIDFGGADRINLTEDTSPNFLGGAMRVHDFMAASLDELRQYSEEPQLGGM